MKLQKISYLAVLSVMELRQLSLTVQDLVIMIVAHRRVQGLFAKVLINIHLSEISGLFAFTLCSGNHSK